MPLCCAVTDSGRGQAFSWAPSRKQPFQLQGENFALRSLYPSFSYCIRSPRGNFIDINWSSVPYGSESRNSLLRLPESAYKKSQPAAALYKSLVETGRVLFSTDQPLSTSLGVPTSLHAWPGNILSCSSCVQHGNWCDYVTWKFPAEAAVPLTYDKVSPATCLCCGSSEPWCVKQLIFLTKV